MNKKISTRVGIITAFVILSYILILVKIKVDVESTLNLVQFAILFIGILISRILLQKYYADISFFDSFMHGMKTLATILAIVILGNSILFFILSSKGEPLSNLTYMIMKTIFAYSTSGVLSALISSLIFNTFTKK